MRDGVTRLVWKPTQYIIMIWVKSSIIVITGQKSGVGRRIPKWKGAGAMIPTSSSSGTIQCVGPDQVKDIQSMIEDFSFPLVYI